MLERSHSDWETCCPLLVQNLRQIRDPSGSPWTTPPRRAAGQTAPPALPLPSLSLSLSEVHVMKFTISTIFKRSRKWPLQTLMTLSNCGQHLVPECVHHSRWKLNTLGGQSWSLPAPSPWQPPVCFLPLGLIPGDSSYTRARTVWGLQRLAPLPKHSDSEVHA